MRTGCCRMRECGDTQISCGAGMRIDQRECGDFCSEGIQKMASYLEEKTQKNYL